MEILKTVYNAIIDFFVNATKFVSIDLYSFIFLGLALIVFIIGIFTMCFSKEAKTSRKLVKLNNYLVQNKETKSVDFIERFNAIIKKGNDRVRDSYFAFLTKSNQGVEEIFSDTRINSGYAKKKNNVKPICSGLALLTAFISFGIGAVSGAEIGFALFKAVIFPVIIIFIGYIYSIIFAMYKRGVENTIGDYSKALSEGSIPFFLDEQDNMLKIKEQYCAESGIRLFEYGKQSFLNESLERLAGMSDEEYAKEIARLTKEKEELENAINTERKNIMSAKEKLDRDIDFSKQELNNVRAEISNTDDAEKQAILLQQAGSQEKLVEALEKLKSTQTQQYDESEAKIQNEIDRIDVLLKAKNDVIKKAPAKQETTEKKSKFKKSKDIPQPEPIKNTSEETEQQNVITEEPINPPQEEPKPQKAGGNKNINDALNDLLNTMNKYKKGSGDKK